jgi:hypothetical protein
MHYALAAHQAREVHHGGAGQRLGGTGVALDVHPLDRPHHVTDEAILDRLVRGQRRCRNGILDAQQIRDRLFMRVAAELQLQRWDGAKDVDGILPDTADPTQRTVRAGTKLIWLPRREQRLELLAAGDFTRQDHIADVSVLPDAQPRYEASDLALSALWQGRLTPRPTGRAQLYGERNLLREQPLDCAGAAQCTDVPQYDHFPRLRLSGNWTRYSESIQRAMELVAAVEAPLLETSWLRSSARFTTRTRATDYRASVRYPGDLLVELNGTIPAFETVFFANDPRLGDPAFGPVRDDASGLRLMQTLEVPVTVASQLQLSPGLALVTARARTARGDRLQQSSFAPAISANWQAPSAMPLWLRAGVARRVDADPSDDTLRLPKTEQLSLQLRGRGRRLLGIDADVYLDMMRIMQARSANQVAVDAPSFTGASSGDDSWYRIGLEYRY